MSHKSFHTDANWMLRNLERLTRLMGSLADDTPIKSEDDKTRFQYYTVFLFIGLPNMLFFGIYAWLMRDNALMSIIAFTAGSLIYGWYLLRTLSDGRVVYRVNSLVFAALILYMVQTGGSNGSKILWTYVYPLIVFFLFGKKEGFFWSCAILVAAIVLFWRPVPFLPAFDYGAEFEIRFITTYCIVSLITFWFEHTRHHFRIDKKVFKTRVDERTAELVQVNQQLKQAMEKANQLTQRAEAANMAKSDFLATMSHEIRTPMNSIIGLSHLALQNHQLDDQTKDYINGVHGAALSLLGIIDEILDFSKIEAHKLFLEKVDFNLEEVLGNVADLLGSKATEKNLDLLFFYAQDIPFHLKGDPLRLRQIFINLISNAIKFTETGEIVISIKLVEKKPNKVRLQFKVSDTGIGLTPDQMGLLFEPFSQADSSTTRKFGGSGLGLAICSRLAKLMDGEIGAQSQYGIGSTFTFSGSFGLADTTDETDPHACRADFKGKQVLVVDSQSTSRTVLRYMLKSLGFGVIAAPSCENAQSKLGKRRQTGTTPALVMVDRKALDQDNDGFINNIISMHIPIIVIEAPAENSRETDSVNHGGNILIKPVLFSSLKSRIQTCLGLTIGKNTKTKLESAKGRPNLAALNDTRVLVVEDKKINQQIACGLLQKVGAHVSVAENGIEALSALEHKTFDMVLMDIQMPEMDGFQATRAIREDGRFDNLPIIAMTAHALAGDREKCFQAGMNDYLSKPIIPNRLYSVLSGWMPLNTESYSVADNDVMVAQLAEKLPNFDVAGALERVFGNIDLYRELLGDFRKNYAEAIPEIQNLIQSSEISEARHRVHNLKGVCGNLGADHLIGPLKALEKALDHSPQPEEIARMIDHVREMLYRGFAAIDTLAVKQPYGDPAFGEAMDRDQLIDNIKELADLLKQGRLDATDRFAEIENILPPKFRINEYYVLADAVRRLDYQNAHKALVNFANTLQSKP